MFVRKQIVQHQEKVKCTMRSIKSNITRHAKKMSRIKKREKPIRTDSNLTQMCDLAERNIEMVVINVLLVFKC